MGQLLFYPYNTHIVLLGGYFSKLIGSVDLAIKILPIVCITGSIILNVLIVRKITNFKVAHISIVLSVLNIFIYWQAPVLYTYISNIFYFSNDVYIFVLENGRNKKNADYFVDFIGSFRDLYLHYTTDSIGGSVSILIENILKFRKGYSVKVLSSVVFCLILIVSFKGITTKLNLSTDNEVEKFRTLIG